MPLQPDDRDDDRLLGIHTVKTNRYDAVHLRDGGVIIYDTEEQDAWVQTGEPVELAERV
jgi:hypothetical protein